MISRFKWYAVRLPCPPGEAFEKLEQHRYEPDKTSGFIVDPTERSFHFFWKTSFYANTLNSDGESHKEEVLSLSSQKVTVLGDECIVFRTQDPPRSSREMLNALDKVFGFGFTCEQIFITEKLVRASIESFEAITLNTVKLSGAISSISAVARVEIASKVGIDQMSISNFGLSDPVIDAGTFSVRYRGSTGQVGFTRSGVCKISGELAPRLQAMIESKILKNARRR